MASSKDESCNSRDENECEAYVSKPEVDVPADVHVDKRVCIHIDLDCFYAQCEELRNPKLKGLPVGVQQKTILATTNYVARSRGVGKMDSIANAKRVCPDIVIVNGEDLTFYRQTSEKIFVLLKELFPGCPVQRLGFDEFFIDVTAIVATQGVAIPSKQLQELHQDPSCHVVSRLEDLPQGNRDAAAIPAPPTLLRPSTSARTETGSQSSQPSNGEAQEHPQGSGEPWLAPHQQHEQDSGLSETIQSWQRTLDTYTKQNCRAYYQRQIEHGALLARRARHSIRKQLNLTSCAGVGTSKMVAKMGGELFKPDQQTAVMPWMATAMIRARQLRKIPGFGRSMRYTLQDQGITTVQQVLALSMAELGHILSSKEALFLFFAVRGYDNDAVTMTGRPKSISNEDNIGPCSDTSWIAFRVEGVVKKLARRVIEDHIQYARWPRTFRLSVCGQRYRDRRSRQTAFPQHPRHAEEDQLEAALMEQAMSLLKDLRRGHAVVSVVNVAAANFSDSDRDSPAKGGGTCSKHQPSMEKFVVKRRKTSSTTRASLADIVNEQRTRHDDSIDSPRSSSDLNHEHGRAVSDVDDGTRYESGTDTDTDGLESFLCEQCGVRLPAWCRAAHLRFHSLEE